MQRNIDKAKYTIWQNVQYMLRMACQSKKSGVIICCLLTSVLQVLSSLTRMLVTPVILRCVEEKAPFSELIWTIIAFSVAIMALSGVITYVDKNKQLDKITVRRNILLNLIQKDSTTSYPNLESQSVQKIQRRAYNTVAGNDGATEAIWNTLSDIIKSLGGFVLYLLMLTAVDPVIILVTAITAVVGYGLNCYTKNWKYRHKEEVSGYENKKWHIIRRAKDIKLAKDLRIFGMESWIYDMYESVMVLYRKHMFRRERVCLTVDILNALLTFLRNGVAYFYLISMTLRQGLPVSEFLLYFATVGGFTTWIGGIFDGFGRLYEHSLELSMLREYLELPELFLFEEGESVAEYITDGPEREDREEISLELKNVSFRYPEAEEDVLHHINLMIKPGEKLAVVGLNGAGKTTLVKLLCGFYDPTEGEVLFCGRNVRKLNRKEYYSLFSAIFQDFSVLEVTVAENVAQTDVDIDMERVRNCIEKAGLTQRIENLPEGYETHIGRNVYEDGMELSGGELQRLMLARALYKNAPVLVLDEPTAALDPLAEHDIYQKYNDMTGKRTSIYISHRLASTRFCDRIIYLKKGQIAESGTHEELLRKNGEYASLFEVQSKYYGEEKWEKKYF